VKGPIVFDSETSPILPLDPPPKGEVYTLFLGVSDTLIEDLSLHEDDTVRVEPVGDSLYLYSVGATNDKLALLNNYREAQQLGFSDSRVTELGADGGLVHDERLADTKIVNPGEILDVRIKTDQILASFEIFYGYNVFALTEENKRELDRLASAYPITENRRVLISSFTDSKGNDAYNLELSKKRSESVRNRLEANGYPADRIEVEYYGRRVPAEMEPLGDAQRRKSLIIVYEKN
jgi:outer membrane protein OmpA-like peptidoglycan-associated protein